MNGNDLRKYLKEEELIEDDCPSHQQQRDKTRRKLLEQVNRVAAQNKRALESAENISKLLEDLHA